MHEHLVALLGGDLEGAQVLLPLSQLPKAMWCLRIILSSCFDFTLHIVRPLIFKEL